ncbi:hypothetical protein PV08_00555 [Exophiala spinifera]|uniref:Uncharacterized protein n=1 Tax=Exophiala spinifera TaxID=91928 RepID=A0A0D2BN57_9EURO|nr:uncharacterized protein PV08_00555 [Exophiala spinifera]KIW19980.1 hypothetical protein PV08_00555 [Exophiala spinifera]
MGDSTYHNDIHLAGLVQAATAAANEHAKRVEHGKYDETFTHDESLAPPEGLGDAPDPAAESQTLKRRYSASVLFREPPSKSRSYSRPSSGKVFESLDLAPENFLRLQVAAKAFMLDEAYPERRAVVGHKKSPNIGGVEASRLKLWNCVEEFLSVHGYGEKYFGQSDGGRPRTLVWPEHSEAIIKHMMPLMRKMVTNERQRLYAATTRKQATPKDHHQRRPHKSLGETNSSLIDAPMSDISGLELAETAPLAPANDSVPASEAGLLSQEMTEPSSTVSNGSIFQAPSTSPPRPAFKEPIVLYVNVVSNTGGARRRVMPRFELRPEAAPSLAALMDQVNQRYRAATGNKINSKDGRPIIQVWLTDGLVTVLDDGDWMVALLSAGVVDWMDNEIRVLVEV